MKNFLNKEFKLCLAPVNYVYMCFAVMTIIPAYPKYVPFFFFCVSILHLFNNSMLNKDLEYSMILPITKKDIVKSRCLLVAAYELICAVLTIPFSFLFTLIMPTGNVAGIEGNVAFYGLALILLTLFNFTFFISFYKKAFKPGLPFIKASIIFWIGYFIVEFPVWTKNIFGIEYFKMLDQIDSASQIKQLPVLIAGIVIFFLGWFVTYKISAKRFEKVDL